MAKGTGISFTTITAEFTSHYDAKAASGTRGC